MQKHTSFKSFFISLLLLSVISYFGCEKKVEKTDQPKEEISTDGVTPDTTAEIKDPVIEEKIIIPDIKGTWTGIFDGKSTTLNITEQTNSSFSGKISISYREAINQDIKGSFSPTTLKMTMTDQLHSRYQGSYAGNLSKDLNSFSGTFTLKVDGSKFSFNFNKK
jgi:hypothetical protein